MHIKIVIVITGMLIFDIKMKLTTYHIHIFKRCLISLAFSASVIIIHGCASSPADRNAVDNLPWNTPTDWEQNVLGVPY